MVYDETLQFSSNVIQFRCQAPSTSPLRVCLQDPQTVQRRVALEMKLAQEPRAPRKKRASYRRRGPGGGSYFLRRYWNLLAPTQIVSNQLLRRYVDPYVGKEHGAMDGMGMSLHKSTKKGVCQSIQYKEMQRLRSWPFNQESP